MAQWSNQDASSNSVLWAPTSVRLTPNTTNRDALFGNTTANAFTSGRTEGMFGVDVTEIAVSNGSIVSYTVTSAGSGYIIGDSFTISADANSKGQLLLSYLETANA